MHIVLYTPPMAHPYLCRRYVVTNNNLQLDLNKTKIILVNFSIVYVEIIKRYAKAHAWKACKRETVSRVRIPLSPPFKYPHTTNKSLKLINRIE